MARIAIFNPQANRWEKMAYAFVENDDEALELCKKHGYSTWELSDENEYTTPAGKLFLQSIEQLA